MDRQRKKPPAGWRVFPVAMAFSLGTVPVFAQAWAAQDPGGATNTAAAAAPGPANGVIMMAPIRSPGDPPPKVLPTPAATAAARPTPLPAPVPSASPRPVSVVAAPAAPRPLAPIRPAKTPPRPLSARDKANLTQAFAAVKRGDWAKARALAEQTKNDVARLIVEWRYLLETADSQSFDAINAFLDDHPGWPRREVLIARAEQAMPLSLTSAQVIAWYGNRAPSTGQGMLRLGEALIAAGRRNEGVDLIRKAWVTGSFNAAEEEQILQVHGDIIGPNEHRARVERFLSRDDTVNVRRLLPRLDEDSRRIAEARLKLKAAPASAQAVHASLPQRLQTAPDYLVEQARAFRLSGQDEQAWEAMLKVPLDKTALLPEAWWTERHIMARDALKAKKYDIAYQLVSRHAMQSGSAFADAEFLSGWIALRFLHRPERALEHFRAMAAGVTLPISKARAQYWLGRTEEALNHPAEAYAHYREAGENSETYYGQLALARLKEEPVLHLKAAFHAVPPAQQAAFNADERVQAIRILSAAGEKDWERMFAVRLASDLSDSMHLQLLAQLMVSVNDRAMSVRVAKLASYNDVLLLSYLDPMIQLPKAPATALPVEPALVLGLTRQESEFDPGAVSVAGARGLMQLMPASAKKTATIHKLKFKLDDLTAKPQYNMQLGMTALGDYLNQWGGSYILTIAAYNAGSGNVTRWIETYGDPRDPNVDPVDWIELIPFGETRNYVQRVLENINVYRNRLADGDHRLGIMADLARPNRPNVTVVRYEAPQAVAAVPVPAQGGVHEVPHTAANAPQARPPVAAAVPMRKPPKPKRTASAR